MKAFSTRFIVCIRNKKMSTFKFFLARDKFSRIDQIFLKFANINYNWKIYILKNIFFKKKWLKIWHAFWQVGTPISKIDTPLEGWLWHAFGFARLLARWQVNGKCWHAFGKFAYRHVEHAGTHGSHGTRFNKLLYLLNYLFFNWMKEHLQSRSVEQYDFSKKLSVIDLWCILKGALSGLRQFLAAEAALKMMKNVFISPQKLIPFSTYLSFCLDFLVMYQNGLIKNIRLILNFMTS